MGGRTRLGIWTITAALILGVSGDYLLRGIPWGLNVTLLILALTVLVVVPVWRGWASRPRGRWATLLIIFAGVLGVCVILRASPVVMTLNILGALIALALAGAAWRWSSGPRGVWDVGFGAACAGVFSGAGPVPASVREISWGEIAPAGWKSTFLSVLRGVLIAVPLLFAFGALLVAADAVFEQIVTDIFDFDIAEVMGHVALILFLFWIVAGYLYVTLLSGGLPEIEPGERPGWLSLGLLEISVTLGSLNVLFLSFVIVQAGYLFGTRPEVAAGLTYSEYARRGFFELVAVAALVIPLLLAAHWLLRRTSRRNRVVFRLLAGTMISLVFVMMISALWRMYLYYLEFGMTELRFYTTAFMFWIGMVLIFYLAFVLRERRDLFAGLTLISGFAAILAINAVNPDAAIARSNIDRYLDNGADLDVYYLTQLSEDAAPVVFQSLPETGDLTLVEDYEQLGYESDSDAAQTLEEISTQTWSSDPDMDWRSWNLSRARASALAADISNQNDSE